MSDELLRARIRQEVLTELRNAINDVGRIASGDGHLLILSSYEVANLRAALQATGYGSIYRSPLQVLNNGDWLGQILHKLYGLADNQPPNADAGTLAERAVAWEGNVAIEKVREQVARAYYEVMMGDDLYEYPWEGASNETVDEAQEFAGLVVDALTK